MTDTTRVLITGSRFVTPKALGPDGYRQARQIVWDALYAATDDFGALTVIQGTAPGADTIAGRWADAEGHVNEAHPADWKGLGKRAGFVRNAEMVKSGARICLAFPILTVDSRGTRMCMKIAADAGIEVREFGIDLPVLDDGYASPYRK